MWRQWGTLNQLNFSRISGSLAARLVGESKLLGNFVAYSVESRLVRGLGGRSQEDASQCLSYCSACWGSLTVIVFFSILNENSPSSRDGNRETNLAF